MSIELKPGAAIPKPAPARRVSPEILQEIREDCELRIAQGWMRKTVVGDRCRFASPVVAARQPGKTRRRICGDYRAINEITLLHQYPVKDAREVTAQFRGAKYFGKADMYKGYFQLRLDEEAQELLAIRTPDALYYPLTLPFGPASGPAQFQQRVSEVLGDLEGHGVASYIDDLGLYATSFDQYLQRLETMLQRLDSVDIRLNGAKCEFGQRSMQFLGHTVSEAGIAHTPGRIEAIKQMAVPEAWWHALWSMRESVEAQILQAAAFIIAVRGTVGQAVLLGLAATLSHTAIVWAVALGGVCPCYRYEIGPMAIVVMVDCDRKLFGLCHFDQIVSFLQGLHGGFIYLTL
jgi:hypothetical protein